MITKILIAVFCLLFVSFPIVAPIEPKTTAEWIRRRPQDRGRLTKRICSPLADGDLFERCRLQKSLSVYIYNRIGSGYSGELQPIIDDWKKQLSKEQKQ